MAAFQPSAASSFQQFSFSPAFEQSVKANAVTFFRRASASGKTRRGSGIAPHEDAGPFIQHKDSLVLSDINMPSLGSSTRGSVSTLSDQHKPSFSQNISPDARQNNSWGIIQRNDSLASEVTEDGGADDAYWSDEEDDEMGFGSSYLSRNSARESNSESRVSDNRRPSKASRKTSRNSISSRGSQSQTWMEPQRQQQPKSIIEPTAEALVLSKQPSASSSFRHSIQLPPPPRPTLYFNHEMGKRNHARAHSFANAFHLPSQPFLPQIMGGVTPSDETPPSLQEATPSTSFYTSPSALSVPSPALMSRRHTLSDHGSYRSDQHSLAASTVHSIPVPINDGLDAIDIMADHLYQLGRSCKWFSNKRGGGVSIRVKTGIYRTFEKGRWDGNVEDGIKGWEEGLRVLNPECAIKMRSRVVNSVMSNVVKPHMTSLAINSNTRIQILDSLFQLGSARKHQFAAFVRQGGWLIVWDDSCDTIFESCKKIEEDLMEMIWRSEKGTLGFDQENVPEVEVEVGVEVLPYVDLEAFQEEVYEDSRPLVITAPILDAVFWVATCAVISLGIRTLVKEFILDRNPLRFCLILFSPLLFAISMFCCNIIVTCFAQMFGPVSQYNKNTKFYSGVSPQRTEQKDLPHITIQMPVYKEGLEAVIIPTVNSLKKAITTYERQGGSASILCCDDGFNLLSEEDKVIRREFYHDNGIGFVARPAHGDGGYERRGRFKKASNLNFACTFSLRVEEILDTMRPAAQMMKKKLAGIDEGWFDEDESQLYEEVLQRVLAEHDGTTVAAAGQVRIGEIILIIDSDTRVPSDCFLDAASELIESPEVAIIQHSSAVMQVAHHYFENGISYFTRRVNTAISFSVANNDNCPFVGHNAFLRWSACQEVAFIDEYDKKMKIWSEAHVSEDFDIALRLQMNHWVLRWATYSDGGFQEGVSLTCDDELNRWQKYAYGVSEMIFHPLKLWLFKGPFTPLFKKFIASPILLHCKLTSLSYMFSYYAIACACLLTTMNYFLIGFDIPIDGFYLNSWKISLTCIVIFSLLGNLAFCVFCFRLKLQSVGQAVGESLMWMLFLFVFFSGISWHVMNALLAHLFSYNMTWSATVKEVNASNFFAEVPAILKRFWAVYLVMFTALFAMIILSTNLVPAAFQITSIEAIWPMSVLVSCHILYPIVLNPWLMHFQF